MKQNKQAATWIWYPGDFEIWLGNIMNCRRTERGTFFPPFWKMDSHFVTVEFSHEYNLSKEENVKIKADGRYNVKIDGKLLFGQPAEFTVPAGKHKINIKVWNQSAPPSVFINGITVRSDASWLVTNEDKEWIDESGKASDTSTSIYVQTGSWNFNSPETPPSEFSLPTTYEEPGSSKELNGGTLYDFGKETFGYLTFKGIRGNGKIHIYYGESEEEATDTNHCETLDLLSVDGESVTDLSTGSDITDERMHNSKAFRYVFITTEGTADTGKVGMLYEFLPEEERGTFTSNDELVNKMWQIGARTLQLTTREFFIDGIKRDRWTWSGDALQSYLMNYYLFFDSATVKRTIRQLRGKDPVTAHINTIMDYTFYWLISISDYYMYTGDADFVKEIYPKMKTLMDYCLERTDGNGMMQGLAGDWVFVDWSPEKMDKHGELSFEQILFCRSLQAMALCAGIVNDETARKEYAEREKKLRQLIPALFWNSDRNAFIHNVVDGKKSDVVTRYSNIFGILFDYLKPEETKRVVDSVLTNDKVMRITTPYMNFYEMEALCKVGMQDTVLKDMKEYWGGMLRHGATSFWEAYDPKIDEKGLTELRPHLSMYGRPYGKSLCHAWGASPIYLLGKYFLGVKPTAPGYRQWEARPCLGGLKWMEGTVPTPNGTIHVYMDDKTIKVKADEGTGILVFNSKGTPTASSGKPERMEDSLYRITIPPKEEIMITY